jgi:hypothetical protein
VKATVQRQLATIGLIAAALPACASPLTKPTSTATVTVTQSGSSTVAATVQPAADPTDRSTYETVTERQFALMMKDPNTYIGLRIVICGKVTQFDTSTGRTRFRADVMGQPGSKSKENSMIDVVDPSLVKNVVEGDSVTMFVEIAGTQTYRTRIGGEQKVPKFTANVVEPFHRDTWPATPTPQATASNAAPKSAAVPPITDPDLGLDVPLARPACDGTGIVVLGSAYTPGKYREQVQKLLSLNPGSSYLRTDLACPSLRQSVDGNPVYAVYRVAGTTTKQVCALLATVPAGPGTYGKWLDTNLDPDNHVECGRAPG